MSLALLFPLGLAALAALLLPLLVHLARREEQRPTDFAALRWLSARLRPRQKLRFEEWLLLALRLLLLAALALLLARPVLFGGAGDAPWLLVLPGADASAAPAMPEGTERRWLAPGFPSLDAPMPAGPIATASLLRQLDAELPAATSVTVLVPAVIDGADGARPQLAREIDWRVVDGAATVATTSEPAAFALAIRHDPEQTTALRYLRAASAAWRGDSDAAEDIALPDVPIASNTKALAWLAAGELPASAQSWVEAGGQLLLPMDATWPLPQPGLPAWRDAGGETLAVSARLGRGRVVQLRRALESAALPALLEADFPARLHDLLAPPSPAPRRAVASDYRPLPGGASFPETPRELVTPLLWLILALFALERWLATGRREVGA